MMIFTNWGGKQWVPEDMIVAQIVDLVRLGFVRQIMIAVDMYLYWKGGRLKQRWPGGFLQIPDRVVPKLMRAGLKTKHIDTILRDNPRRHLAF
jgi:predicted metal-dependent phosphotriesterase family hydrolase